MYYNVVHCLPRLYSSPSLYNNDMTTKSSTTILVLAVAAVAMLGLAAVVAFPMQEASAALVNVGNGGILKGGNGNKGNVCVVSICKK